MCAEWKAILKKTYTAAVREFSSDRLCSNTYISTESSAYEKLIKTPLILFYLELAPYTVVVLLWPSLGMTLPCFLSAV